MLHTSCWSAIVPWLRGYYGNSSFVGTRVSGYRERSREMLLCRSDSNKSCVCWSLSLLLHASDMHIYWQMQSGIFLQAVSHLNWNSAPFPKCLSHTSTSNKTKQKNKNKQTNKADMLMHGRYGLAGPSHSPSWCVYHQLYLKMDGFRALLRSS